MRRLMVLDYSIAHRLNILNVSLSGKGKFACEALLQVSQSALFFYNQFIEKAP